MYHVTMHKYMAMEHGVRSVVIEKLTWTEIMSALRLWIESVSHRTGSTETGGLTGKTVCDQDQPRAMLLETRVLLHSATLYSCDSRASGTVNTDSAYRNTTV